MHSPKPLSRPPHAEKVEMSTNNKLPCIIFMKGSKNEILDDLLLACAEMSQPVQTLWLDALGAEILLSDNTGNGSVCTEQALTFTLKAKVTIKRVDFRLRSMRMLMESLKACTSLELFRWIVHYPGSNERAESVKNRARWDTPNPVLMHKPAETPRSSRPWFYTMFIENLRVLVALPACMPIAWAKSRTHSLDWSFSLMPLRRVHCTTNV